MSDKSFAVLEADIRQYLAAHLNDKKGRLAQIETLVEQLKNEWLTERLERLWTELISHYSDCQSCTITLDYVPEMAMLELWGIELDHNGLTHSWSAHWFDKPLSDARTGMWAEEIALSETMAPDGFNIESFWNWARSTIVLFEKDIARLAQMAGTSEGVSAFTIEQSSVGLKLTAEAL